MIKPKHKLLVGDHVHLIREDGKWFWVYEVEKLKEGAE
jgi:hypothetical protein